MDTAGEDLAAHVLATLDASVARTGVFLDACAHHTAMGTDIWEDVVVDGVAMVDAVVQWLEYVFHPTANDEMVTSRQFGWVAKEAYPCTKCCGAYHPNQGPGF